MTRARQAMASKASGITPLWEAKTAPCTPEMQRQIATAFAEEAAGFIICHNPAKAVTLDDVGSTICSAQPRS